MEHFTTHSEANITLNTKTKEFSLLELSIFFINSDHEGGTTLLVGGRRGRQGTDGDGCVDFKSPDTEPLEFPLDLLV